MKTVLLAVIAVASATHNDGKNAHQAASTSKGPAPNKKSPLVLTRDPTGVAPNSFLERIASLKLQDDKLIKISPSKSLQNKANKVAPQVPLPEGIVKGRVSRLVRRIDSKNSNLKLDRAEQEVQQNLDTAAEIRERASQRNWGMFGTKENK